MQLTLAQTARLFSVSESVVARWIRIEHLPASETNSEYRFDRSKVLEWATANHKPFSPERYRDFFGLQPQNLSLAEALDRGGVAMCVAGADRYEVLRNAVSGLPENLGLDREILLDLLIAREKSGGTSIGGGIVIPHVRYPVVIPGGLSVLRVCYLAQALRYPVEDDEPVHTLFIMTCPTVHEHLQLLASLISVLRAKDFCKLLATRPDKSRLLSAVRAVEESPSIPFEVI